MNRLGFLFIAALFFTLGLYSPSQNESRSQQTVQTLFPKVLVAEESVDDYFSGTDWLEQTLASKKIDLNSYYQKHAFKRTLAESAKPVTEKLNYSTWIEKRECVSSPMMDKPVRARVTSRYGLRVHPLSGRRHIHAGIDFRGKKGTPVIASSGGYIKAARRKGAYGKTVIVSHGNSYTTLYGHLSDYAVKEGDWVNQGQTLGYIGSTGRATGPHLHFEVRCHNVPVNPIAFVGKQNRVAKVSFRRRRRKIHTYRELASKKHIQPRIVKRDSSYYTRYMNLQKLRNLKKSIQ